ncbi:DinB family protein [Ferruginibacter sp. SUN106]|uniref:DinB family protein n=1 Tax=Ferruginibacter sp. SUN106 TaxID=2978348 RepID=UPI003D35FE54
MEETAQQLDNIVNTYSVEFLNFTEAELALKPAADKWSKKEIIGHLIDSAQNNIRRFIVTQYETTPHIVYAQDNWVSIQNYKEYNSKDLITLWSLLNRHIVVILKNMPVANYQLQCNTGKEQEQLHTIEFLAKDYITHHLHHLKQIVV